jgi:hypothetical protein
VAICQRERLKKEEKEAAEAGDLVAAQRLKSCKKSGAGKWLTIIPSEPQFQLHNREFAYALCLRLGISVVAPLDRCECKCGNELEQLRDPAHALGCKRYIRETCARHELLCRVIHEAAQEAQFCVTREPTITVEDRGLLVQRRPRADEELASASGMLLLDITVLHPTSVSAVRQADGGVRNREREKQRRYGPLAASAGADFKPVVLETYGGLADEAREVVRYIAREAEENNVCDASLFRERLLGRLAIAVQRGNAMVLAHAKRDGAALQLSRAVVRRPGSR